MTEINIARQRFMKYAKTLNYFIFCLVVREIQHRLLLFQKIIAVDMKCLKQLIISPAITDVAEQMRWRNKKK